MSAIQEKTPLPKPAMFRLVIHGGAGTMDKSRATPEVRAQYKAALRHALLAGYAVLSAGGEAMDAAVAAVSSMENCPLFNAGKGAVYNVAGKQELESSIMLSKPPATHPDVPLTRRGVGVTLVSRARNPSHLARALYLAPAAAPHTMFSGEAAEELGAPFGVEFEDPSYFFSEVRWREHRRGLGLPEEPLPYPSDSAATIPVPGAPAATPTDLPMAENPNTQFPASLLPNAKGTVGAVALDARGCVAAVTSTGGRTNKLVGRVGDTPILGCGTWAEEWEVDGWARRMWRRFTGAGEAVAVGVSGTGDGDYFIRLATASTVGRRMKYLNEPLEVAAKTCVEELRRDGGLGGVIALDNAGNITMPLNSSGMYRGVIYEDGIPKTALFAEDELD